MSSIASSLSELFHALLSLVTDAFNSVYSVIAALFATVAAFVGGLVGLTADTAGFIISTLFLAAPSLFLSDLGSAQATLSSWPFSLEAFSDT